MSGSIDQEEEDARRICNVCHLPYAGEECPVCKAEREHASAVIEERGRRHRKDEDENWGGR